MTGAVTYRTVVVEVVVDVVDEVIDSHRDSLLGESSSHINKNVYV